MKEEKADLLGSELTAYQNTTVVEGMLQNPDIQQHSTYNIQHMFKHY